MFKARWRASETAPSKLLHGPGDLWQLWGGELLLIGEPEPQFQAGAWSDALSSFVLHRRGKVRWAE